MSMSNRRRELSPRSNVGSSKLRMDRQPLVARITDPSLTIGKRKELDNVMKKARASKNDYWHKKLLEVEEKDPNRWRHSGYKKLYVKGESSSDSDSDSFNRYNQNKDRRSRSRNRKPMGTSSTATSSVGRNDSKRHMDSRSRRSPQSPMLRRRSSHSPDVQIVKISDYRRRPRSPPEPSTSVGGSRRRSPRSPISPIDSRRRSPLSPSVHSKRRLSPPNNNNKQLILPRSKRPPSPPPPKPVHSPSNSSLSSCSDDSCSVCSPKHHGRRSRSITKQAGQHRPSGPRSPPLKSNDRIHRNNNHSEIGHRAIKRHNTNYEPSSSSSVVHSTEKHIRYQPVKHGIDDKTAYGKLDKKRIDRHESKTLPNKDNHSDDVNMKHSSTTISRASYVPEDPRLKIRPPEPPEAIMNSNSKIVDTSEKLRAKVKIEGEKRKKTFSSDSDESSSSDSLPTFTATTRLTLSDRFGKMAQWSLDRSNMENMRITKDSAGGPVRVMIEKGLESPPRRYSYSPAPAGHFPKELATTAPTGLMSWDDVRVRYEYYKSRGYLRDLDLKDYVKWEEWWYKYQEWLKQERYYEFYERQQMHRRRRKKIPITQRLN